MENNTQTNPNNTPEEGNVQNTSPAPAEAPAPASNPSQPAEANFSLDELLDLVIDQKASDLHVSEGSRIALRLDGKINFIENIAPLTKAQAEKIILQGLMRGNEKMITDYKETREADFAYEHKDGTPFRVNTFFKRGNMATVLRRINREAFTFEQLGLPDAVNKFTHAKSGLVLVCGPTGSGKSTTLAAIIQAINKQREEHILTIEDPIEYIFDSDKCIISQREVGRDTLAFKNALRALLREDPDIAMIGELRDPETIMTAIELCETGHLVFGTFHTGSAAQTISRLIANFPPEAQSAVSMRLSDALQGLLCQRLIPKIGGGRVGIFELVIANGAIRNLIRTGELAQMDSTIQTGSEQGMITMKRYADKKKNEGLIREEDYIDFFTED